ncbi:PilZ domain-containing protein [Novosphingobium aerophilum]|uniref:PilZ domain-containing protein n=1 Tax=Novosphingobium TaxID=165696 RepID=UPI0006C8CD5A|nr:MULTISPECIES: PilZ domain-containing protein [unclassified Novosphingobium]KPH57595.1 pilus assembly protein PilZ [Novosphingobium sp. ST904]MPS67652.1 PilZ domain-containing protein [Novosphingobium sp.]TCM43193.1 PilZ domain-containing protein [Novosphingobium sp. ST904]WRT93094.1 PilZ domain-containing protein [Novosphingobium sp. RL4]
MNETENRHIARDSLFLMADLRIDGLEGEYRIKVRNLSAGGMMGEGGVQVMRGTVVSVNIRNIGWVPGSVAWVQENRFGVAFSDEIDPKLARATAAPAADHAPNYVRNYEAQYAPVTSTDQNLRKV